MVAEHVERLRERDSRMNEKLSPATYAWKQVRAIGINLFGLVGGGYLGHHIGGQFKPRNLDKTMAILQQTRFANEAELIARASNKWIGMAIGSFAGSLITGVYLGYERWVKGEALRLSADEINRDISEAKLRMDPELLRENHLLREMIAKQDEQLKRGHFHNTPHPQVSLADATLEPSSHALGEKNHGHG